MDPYLNNVFVNVTAEYLSAAFLLIIFLSSLHRKKEIPTKKSFCRIAFLQMMVLFVSGSGWLIHGFILAAEPSPMMLHLRNALISLDFLLYTTIDDLFFLYIVDSVRERRQVSKKTLRREKIIFWVNLNISLLTSIAFALSVWTGLFFTLNEHGIIELSTGYNTMVLLGATSEVFCVGLILKERKMLGARKTIAVLLYLLAPVVLVYIDMAYNLTLSYVACAMCIFIIYVNVDMKQDAALFEREAEVARQEAQMTEMRVNLMMSQIQPHFLFNSLSSISYLCRKDPKEAELAVTEFADYLRMNLRSINNTCPIFFERELSHAENYLKIQKRRFPDQMKVEYDIQATEFRIPALTLQPVVENAVKHAVETRFELTTIRISSRETENSYLVTVQDDGPGFDPTIMPKDDHPHIGIASVRSRLDNMVGGHLEIESTIGVGTTVTVVIPKTQKGRSQ